MDAAGLKLKSAKDSLVSALFELSKSANNTASAIVDFYNTIGEDDEERLEAFTTLTESLQTLTSASNQLHGISSDLVNPMDEDASSLLMGKGKKSKSGDDDADGADDQPPQKKKPVRDPNAPKKPLTVFFAYSAYVRQELRDARAQAGLPPLSSTEITQEISKKWKNLSDEEKEKWKQAYNVELENYQVEKQKYLEAKKNGTLPEFMDPSTNHAPVPLPANLQKRSIDEIYGGSDGHKVSSSGNGENTGSSEKKKKTKKKDKKKDKNRDANRDNN